ncbi:MAG: SRPBCC family protein [Phycisphaerales bacterium]
MAAFSMTKRIEAPVEIVFEVFTDLPRAEERISGVKKLEVLSDGPIGTGTRFSETRVMFGKEASQEMEITDFEPNRGYTVAADSCGCHCRTRFDFLPDGEEATKVNVVFETKPMSFFAKLMSPFGKLMMGACAKAFEQDLEELRVASETLAVEASTTQV